MRMAVSFVKRNVAPLISAMSLTTPVPGLQATVRACFIVACSISNCPSETGRPGGLRRYGDCSPGYPATHSARRPVKRHRWH